jgi:hypothetical protein
LFASGFDEGVAFGSVVLAASSVALFAGWDEVVEVVGAASVVFDEVVCFGGWVVAAPVAEG